MYRVLNSNFFMMKWWSISICLILSWQTWFFAILMVGILSHKTFIGPFVGTLILSIFSLSKCPIFSFNTALSNYWLFFWLLHIPRLPQTNIQYPVVDLLLVMDPTQMAMYTSILLFVPSLKKMPCQVSSSNISRLCILLSMCASLCLFINYLTMLTGKHMPKVNQLTF